MNTKTVNNKFYDKMIAELKRLKIYNLSAGYKAESDIYVIADMLETIDWLIDQLLDGCVITSVNSLNIKNFCKLFALPNNISLNNLKDAVFNRIAIDNSHFTKAGVIKCLNAFGFTASISENFSTNTLTVTITNDKNYFSTLHEKESAIKDCMPCHTNTVIKWS